LNMKLYVIFATSFLLAAALPALSLPVSDDNDVCTSDFEDCAEHGWKGGISIRQCTLQRRRCVNDLQTVAVSEDEADVGSERQRTPKCYSYCAKRKTPWTRKRAYKSKSCSACCQCDNSCAPPPAPPPVSVASSAAPLNISASFEESLARESALYRNCPADLLVLRRGREYSAQIDGLSSASLRGPSDGVAVHGEAGQLTVAVDSNAPIGEYDVELELVSAKQTVRVAVIFNPFTSKDDVYISKKRRAEYVLNEHGLIWQGLIDDNQAHTWAFEQFECSNLLSSLLLLRTLPPASRRSAPLVSRHLSFEVGDKVCYGKWGDGSYTSGRPHGGYRCKKEGKEKCTEPSAWTGSTPILAQFRSLHEAGRPSKVQYCQCFVFAGVMTTIGRSLGIPSRPVTTFQSAHDTNANRAIEKYYEVKDGFWEPRDGAYPFENVHDSVWSFHVWNEMYMRRPDLEGQCGRTSANGWQAVDATPQELSVSGKYECGPMPVRFIKSNCDSIGFDGEFIISEVNANTDLWVKEGTKWTFYDRFSTDPFDDLSTIGQQISTKKAGSDALDDITDSYKEAEPSGPGAPTKKWSPAMMVPAESTELVQLASEEDHRRLAMQLQGPVKLAVTVCGGTACRLGRDVHLEVELRGRPADVQCHLLAKAFDQDYNAVREGNVLLHEELSPASFKAERYSTTISHASVGVGADNQAEPTVAHRELKLWVTGKCSNGQVVAWRRKLLMHSTEADDRAVSV